MTDDQIEHFFANEFRPVGYVISEDHDGNLLLPERKLQEKWKAPVYDVVDFLVDVLPKNNLHGIYLRGSVGCGSAIEGLSDLDFFLLFRNMFDVTEMENIANQYIINKYSFVKYVEFGSSYLDFLSTYEKWGFKISAMHLYGNNILTDLSDLNLLDVPVPVDRYFLLRAKDNVKNDLHLDRCDLNRCASVMKAIMREFFWTIAHRDRVWSSSMYYCFQHFVKHYPKAEALAKKIVYLAIHPTTDIHIVNGLIDEASEWWNKRSVVL